MRCWVPRQLTHGLWPEALLGCRSYASLPRCESTPGAVSSIEPWQLEAVAIAAASFCSISWLFSCSISWVEVQNVQISYMSCSFHQVKTQTAMMWQYCQSTLLQQTNTAEICRVEAVSWQCRVLQHGLQLLVSLTSLFQRIVRLWGGATSRQRKFKKQISWVQTAVVDQSSDLPWSSIFKGQSNCGIVVRFRASWKFWLLQLLSFPQSKPTSSRSRRRDRIRRLAASQQNWWLWIILHHYGSFDHNHNMS